MICTNSSGYWAQYRLSATNVYWQHIPLERIQNQWSDYWVKLKLHLNPCAHVWPVEHIGWFATHWIFHVGQLSDWLWNSAGKCEMVVIWLSTFLKLVVFNECRKQHQHILFWLCALGDWSKRCQEAYKMILLHVMGVNVVVSLHYLSISGQAWSYFYNSHPYNQWYFRNQASMSKCKHWMKGPSCSQTIIYAMRQAVG